MKIVIPGGSGQVGAILRRALSGAGHEVIVLSRRPRRHEVYWDGQTLGPWARELEGAGAVINLAGRSVNCLASGGKDMGLRERSGMTPERLA